MNENYFELDIPKLPEEFINMSKLVAVVKGENGNDPDAWHVGKFIWFWEKQEEGYKLKVFIEGYSNDQEEQVYLDLKFYLINGKDMYGLQKYKI